MTPSAAREEVRQMNGWIKIKLGCRMPKENQDILYVVDGLDYDKPYVMRGSRNYVVNGGWWWWCDLDGEFSEVGNDGEHSYVSHWQPTPKAPRTRKRLK